MTNEHEFTRGVNPLCPNDQMWSARDEQSSEDEVNEFIFGLIRLIKPQFVVETGCYMGDGTVAIANALKANRSGKMITCDTDESRVEYVKERVKNAKLDDVVQVIHKDGQSTLRMVGDLTAFAFIDSSPDGEVRLREIETLLEYARFGDMFLLHDTAPQHETIDAVAKVIGKYPQIRFVYFNCPRGLTLFQVVE